jgi:hypothetical protein
VHGGLNPTLGLVAPEAAGDLDIPVVATFHSWFAGSALCRCSGDRSSGGSTGIRP